MSLEDVQRSRGTDGEWQIVPNTCCNNSNCTYGRYFLCRTNSIVGMKFFDHHHHHDAVKGPLLAIGLRKSFQVIDNHQ